MSVRAIAIDVHDHRITQVPRRVGPRAVLVVGRQDVSDDLEDREHGRASVRVGRIADVEDNEEPVITRIGRERRTMLRAGLLDPCPIKRREPRGIVEHDTLVSPHQCR